MSEEQTAEVQQTSSAETTAAESQSGQQTTDTSAKTAETASTGETKTETPVVQESKPLSRRSAAYRIQQLSRENAELKRAQAPKIEEQNVEGEEPQEAPNVAEEVQKHLKPIVSEFSKSADDGELKEFFTGKTKEREQYESKIRDMWKLDQYKDVAASELYKLLSYDSAITAAKTAAVEEYKAAEQKATQESSGGHSSANRTGIGAKSPANLSAAELQAHNDKIKAGQA